MLTTRSMVDVAPFGWTRTDCHLSCPPHPSSPETASNIAFTSQLCPAPLLSVTPRQGVVRVAPQGLKEHVETNTTGQPSEQVPTHWLEDQSRYVQPCCSRCHPAFNNSVSECKEHFPHPDAPDVNEVLSARLPLRKSPGKPGLDSC